MPLEPLALADLHAALSAGEAAPRSFVVGAGLEDDFAALCDAAGLQRVDAIDGQLREWALAVCPPGEDAEIRRLVAGELGADGPAPASYGRWVWFPWRRAVVHLLPPERWFAVRTARNRDKITAAQQARLRGKRIGVVGLSVGHASAVALAQEGLCGELRLADFDRLEVSNLNRVRSSLLHLGLPKVEVAARDVAEIDPDLAVRTFPGGIDEDNLRRFLLDGGKLDLVVEECDTLWVKLAVREACRELGIPVVMDTNDRGTLDVERFDAEPDRPLLHGLLGDVSAAAAKELDDRGKLELFVRFFEGLDGLSDGFRATLPKVGSKLGGWCQLASDTQMGGALVAHAARRILLDDLPSGRYRVDLDQLVGAPPPKASLRLTDDEAHDLLTAAGTAPSGGNVQPWAARLTDDRVDVGFDRDRMGSLLDWRGRASMLGLGMLGEALDLGAAGLGLKRITTFDADAGRVSCRITGRESIVSAAAGERLELLHRRCTNRRLHDGTPLAGAQVAALGAAVAGFEVRLAALSAEADRVAVGRLLGAADRIRFTNPTLHEQLYDELRWTDADVASDDGVDVATLELPDEGLQGIAAMRDPAWMRRHVRPAMLESMAVDACRASSHLVCLLGPDDAPATLLDAGRATLRMWLEATRQRIAVQPWSIVTFLSMRARAGEREQLTVDEARTLQALGEEVGHAFGADGEVPLFVLRLASAPPPRVRARRRPWQRWCADERSPTR